MNGAVKHRIAERLFLLDSGLEPRPHDSGVLPHHVSDVARVDDANARKLENPAVSVRFLPDFFPVRGTRI